MKELNIKVLDKTKLDLCLLFKHLTLNLKNTWKSLYNEILDETLCDTAITKLSNPDIIIIDNNTKIELVTTIKLCYENLDLNSMDILGLLLETIKVLENSKVSFQFAVSPTFTFDHYLLDNINFSNSYLLPLDGISDENEIVSKENEIKSKENEIATLTLINTKPNWETKEYYFFDYANYLETKDTLEETKAVTYFLAPPIPQEFKDIAKEQMLYFLQTMFYKRNAKYSKALDNDLIMINFTEYQENLTELTFKVNTFFPLKELIVILNLRYITINNQKHLMVLYSHKNKGYYEKKA